VGDDDVRGVPPLQAEDHVCQRCGLSYPKLSIAEARERIASVPERARGAVLAIPEPTRRRQPADGGWSAVEYLCHLRDVYITYTIRLHRARTEDRPALEPMFNDLRARRFRYNERDPIPVLDELAATVAGFLDEVDRVGDEQWTRTATRLPGEERTARWMVRQAAHEGEHHLGDIGELGHST
jgi:hypothetical protein